MSEFVHLHLHSDYSLLDGACSVSGVINCAAQFNMPAVAITDHGYMGGALEFYQSLNAARIKPIIGCEMYVSPTNRFDKDPNNPDIRGYHLVVLAENFTGYQNLCRLASRAALEGFYHKPRIDKELLAQYKEGIIALSACLKGEVAAAILNGKIKAAKKIIKQYQDILGKKNFYLEIMDHGLHDQKIVNKELVLLGKEFDIPLVATNDVHFLKREHYKSHDLLLCIGTHSTVDQSNRLKFNSDQFYFKSGAEMAETFRELPESLKTTIEIAERCNISIPLNVNHYPVYELEQKQSPKEYLRSLCYQGLKERYGFEFHQDSPAGDLNEKQKTILERINYEIDVIDNSKYTSYFLIVWDFLKYARGKGIAVGPGRGSGAGSIVAYLTHITDIEPLRYSLLFERFLNPERVSPPDFDIDLCERRRHEVIEYVRNKYGRRNVAQIGTYGTLKAKAVIKDIARVIGKTYSEGETITKLIPDKPPENVKEVTIEVALKESKELKQLYEEKQWVREVIDYARPLEKLNRNMSIHAAGVIIGDQPLENLIPLATGAGNEKEIITQYEAEYCEALGFLKMDLLGLRTLTLIEDTVRLVKKHRNVDINIETVSLEDKTVFSLLNRGDTVAVFQLESAGMRDMCKKFGISRIEDIIALVALYRPGPMQFIPEFISRKTGHTKIEYDHPAMESILKETYGIMLYQEQVMQVVQEVAGFSLGNADILRRAIGKKKTDEMKKQNELFVKGCEKNGVKKEKAVQIWEKINKFAGYGFNKSHSAAYAFLAYRTAYLKANFPVEFMTAVLTSEIDNPDKLASLIQECRKMNIPVLPPDINTSDINFTVDGKSIRFGLAAIKGVGSVAALAIINSREKDGPFKNLLEFCERVGQPINSRTLENLARTGAFCSFNIKRRQIVEVIEPVLLVASSRMRDRANGQGSLFEMLPEGERNDYSSVPVPDVPEFLEQEILRDEKDLLGFYVTGHPLAEFEDVIKTYSTHSTAHLGALSRDSGVKIGGIIESVSVKQSKKGDNYAIIRLEDLEGVMECCVFSKTYDRTKELLKENSPVFIEGIIDSNGGEKGRLIANDLVPLKDVTALYTKEIHVWMHEASTSREDLTSFLNICKNHPGKTQVVLCVKCAGGEIAYIECPDKLNVTTTSEFIQSVHEIFGENSIHLKANASVPQMHSKYAPNGSRNHMGTL